MAKKLDMSKIKQSANKPAGSAGKEQDKVEEVKQAESQEQAKPEETSPNLDSSKTEEVQATLQVDSPKEEAMQAVDATTPSSAQQEKPEVKQEDSQEQAQEEQKTTQEPKRDVGRPRKHNKPMRTISVKIAEDTYADLQMLLAMLLVRHNNKTNLSEYVDGLIRADLERYADELGEFRKK